MRLEDLDYDLPDECIARFPAERREGARLLLVEKSSGSLSHRLVSELPDILTEKDVLVINNTQVIPARLAGRSQSGRLFEILLLKPNPANPLEWECLIRPGRKVAPTLELELIDGTMAMASRSPHAFWITFPLPQIPFLDWLETVGQTPIPPYLRREPTSDDKIRYQTVFAKIKGAVAAPTAGLHFGLDLLNALETKKVPIYEITLHVGYGTFAPLTDEVLQADKLHTEHYQIQGMVWEAIERSRQKGGRVVCVGTTSLRAIESVPFTGLCGTTRLFIKPGFQFQYAKALMTNFHLPRTSLLVLVSAFLGPEKTRKAYRAAIDGGYRFYSYGDAMLIL